MQGSRPRPIATATAEWSRGSGRHPTDARAPGPTQRAVLLDLVLAELDDEVVVHAVSGAYADRAAPRRDTAAQPAALSWAEAVGLVAALRDRRPPSSSYRSRLGTSRPARVPRRPPCRRCVDPWELVQMELHTTISCLELGVPNPVAASGDLFASGPPVECSRPDASAPASEHHKQRHLDHAERGLSSSHPQRCAVQLFDTSESSCSPPSDLMCCRMSVSSVRSSPLCAWTPNWTA